MKNKLAIQFSPTRLKQIKKIALSGSKAKLKILNGQLEEGFQLLKSTAHKLKFFATDLADRIPQTLATRVSLGLFSHFESKTSKKLGIPKGIALGGVLTLMCVLPATGQVVTSTANAGAGTLRQAILDANGTAANEIIYLAEGTTYQPTTTLPLVTGTDVGGTLSIICTGTSNAIIDGNNFRRPLTMDVNANLTISKLTLQNGRVTLAGGGIYNDNGSLTISDCLITNSEVTIPVKGGAGVASIGENASTLIQNSTISLNSSSGMGGGIFNSDGSTLTVINSVISDNSSNYKGGGGLQY